MKRAGLRLPNGPRNRVEAAPDRRPVVAAEDDQRETANPQVLLVAQVAVGRDHEVEPGLFRGRDQGAVHEVGPAHGKGRSHVVSGQLTPQPARNVLVKQDESHATRRTPARPGYVRRARLRKSRSRSLRP